MNPQDFQKSITLELENLKNRVRNLIDDRHWLSDGEFKEAILRNVLKRNLPSNLSLGTGFVINSRNKDITTQIDIIIYENEYPPLFLEGDFVLIESDGVKGIIEVKTKLTNSKLIGAINKLNKNVDVINGCFNDSKLNFVGVFSYDYDGFDFTGLDKTEFKIKEEKLKLKIFSESVQNALIESNGKVNHISLGKNLFIRYWSKDSNILNKPNFDYDFYNFYFLKDMGYSYFISNIYELCSTVDLFKRQWFSFPIDGGKEKYRFKTCTVKKKQQQND